MSVKLESTEQDLDDEVRETVVVLLVAALCATFLGNMYIESQDDFPCTRHRHRHHMQRHTALV